MFVLQKIRSTVSKIDMFSSAEMLRYNDDAQYQTFTGGIFSLGIIITVIAGFFSMISETLDRTAISSTLNVITSGEPPAYNLTSNADNMFMFGIQIQSTDLSFFYDFNGPRRYFDINVIAGALKYGVIQSIDFMPMVQCTDQHWNMIPELVQNKNLLLYNTWLCPQIGSQYLIQGTFVSNIYNQIRISVSKCTNESDPSRPCFPQNQIDDLMNAHGNFYFTVNYINTVINPNEVNYRSYYLQPMDYVIFSEAQGSEIYYLFSDYRIQTDTSIWPFSSFSVDTGAMVPSKAKGISYQVGSGGEYVAAYLTKAPQSLSYQRQVQKLSVVFSYIGGLVGAISAILFILKSYTGTSLEISIAKNLFQQETTQMADLENEQSEKLGQNTHKGGKNKKQSINERFSLMTFVKIHMYQLLKGFKWTENWTGARQMQQLRTEIGKHLDVKNLLKRIINLERYLSYIFDEKQLACLKYQQPIKFHQIKQLRRMFTNQSSEKEQEQIIQPAVVEHKIYKIDTIACDQLIQSSIKNQTILRSPQPLNSINQGSQPSQSYQQKGAGPKRNRNSVFIDREKQILKEYFKELKKSMESNVINKRIWQNSKKYCKQLIQEDVDKQQMPCSKNEKIRAKRSLIKIVLPFNESFE